MSALAKGAKIEIGIGFGFSDAIIGAAESVVLGNNVLCWGNVTITDTDWHGIPPQSVIRQGRVRR